MSKPHIFRKKTREQIVTRASNRQSQSHQPTTRLNARSRPRIALTRNKTEPTNLGSGERWLFGTHVGRTSPLPRGPHGPRMCTIHTMLHKPTDSCRVTRLSTRLLINNPALFPSGPYMRYVGETVTFATATIKHGSNHPVRSITPRATKCVREDIPPPFPENTLVQ